MFALKRIETVIFLFFPVLLMTSIAQSQQANYSEPSQEMYISLNSQLFSGDNELITTENILTRQEIPSKKVVLKSLLVPGWGEYSLRKQGRAQFFFSTEIILITGYSVLKSLAIAQRDDYRNFAVQHASINRHHKDYQYYVDIENYNNLYDFNTQQLRYRQIDDVYPETPDYFWQWDHEKNRKKYERMRIKADSSLRNASFIMSAIFLNHLVSGIDALYFLRLSAPGNSDETQFSLNLGIPFK